MIKSLVEFCVNSYGINESSTLPIVIFGVLNLSKYSIFSESDNIVL